MEEKPEVLRHLSRSSFVTQELVCIVDFANVVQAAESGGKTKGCFCSGKVTFLYLQKLVLTISPSMFINGLLFFF